MKPALILATVVLLVLTWMFRYEIVMDGSSRMVLKLDRWTGHLYLLDQEQWVRVDGSPPAIDLLEKPTPK